MKRLVLTVALLLASCGPGGVGHGSNDHTDPLPPYQEVERNNSIANAQFLGVFSQPDLFHIYGNFNSTVDEDVYSFYIPNDQLTSFNVASTNNVVVEAYMFGKNIDSDQLIPIGHWVGDPGQLWVYQWPTPGGIDRIFLLLSSPGGTIGSYNVEMWAQ